jgi:hypothetical protein
VLDLTIPAPPGVAPELAMDLGRAFDRLPAAQRIAVVLHHYAGYSIDDAAALLGVPQGKARLKPRPGGSLLRVVHMAVEFEADSTDKLGK